MNPEQMRAAVREAELFNAHLMSQTQRLKMHRITEARGDVVVVLNGVGDLEDISINGVDIEVTECLIAAFRAAQINAQKGYKAFMEGRR